VVEVEVELTTSLKCRMLISFVWGITGAAARVAYARRQTVFAMSL